MFFRNNFSLEACSTDLLGCWYVTIKDQDLKRTFLHPNGWLQKSQKLQCAKARTIEIINEYSRELWRRALWGLLRKKLTSS